MYGVPLMKCQSNGLTEAARVALEAGRHGSLRDTCAGGEPSLLRLSTQPIARTQKGGTFNSSRYKMHVSTFDQTVSDKKLTMIMTLYGK
jgi:hypothetical protein